MSRPGARRFTAEDDIYLVAHYHEQTIVAMAAHLGRSWSVVQQRCEVLIARGLLDRSQRYFHRPWTQADEDYLANHWGLLPDDKVAAYLGRTVDACKVRATRFLHLSRSQQFYTAATVAQLFGVDRHVVVRWIQAGVLRARRSHVRTSAGLMWRIDDANLRTFVKSFPWHYDPKRIEGGTWWRHYADRIHTADPWLTVAQAAAELRVCTNTVFRHVERGWLPAQKTWGAGGHGAWRIARSVLATFQPRATGTLHKRYPRTRERTSA